MELAQQLIATEAARHTATLTAIEQATGLIAETEAIAATLRSHGIAYASANGYIIGNDKPTLRAYVSASFNTNADALLQALRDADLPIGYLDIGAGVFSEIHLHGLDVPISVERSVALAIGAAHLAGAAPRRLEPTPEAA